MTTVLLDVDVNAAKYIHSRPQKLPSMCACQSDDVTWSWSNPQYVTVIVSKPHSGISVVCFVPSFLGLPDHILLGSTALLILLSPTPPKTHPPNHPLLRMCGVSCVQEERRAAETMERHHICSSEPQCRQSSGTSLGHYVILSFKIWEMTAECMFTICWLNAYNNNNNDNEEKKKRNFSKSRVTKWSSYTKANQWKT